MISYRNNYVTGFDGLRAVAVSMVFIHHWTELRLGLGIIGVQLFFVLSGFLITRILLGLRSEIERGGQSLSFSLRQFYVRRFLRIFPLYYFCLLLFAALDRFNARDTFLWHGMYLSNVLFFLRGEFWGPFSHFWSLSVEEQFYLGWPLLVLLTPRKHLPVVLVGLIITGPLTRFLTAVIGYEGFVRTNTMVWANFDTLGMGALVATLTAESERIWGTLRAGLKWLLPCCVVEVVAARSVSAPAVWLWLDPLAVAGVSVWALVAAFEGFTGLAGRILNHPLTRYLGRISYGLYVWHMFAPAFVYNLLRLCGFPPTLNDGFSGFALCFFWTVLAASMSWFLLEKPINSIKSSFPYIRGREMKCFSSNQKIIL